MTFAAAVVVPVRNARSVVLEQLGALLPAARAHDLEVVVVDDASTDATPAVVSEWIRSSDALGFRLVCRSKRGGPNAARNEGVRASSADFILFCDGDDVVTPGWASAMLAARADDVILSGAYVDLAHAETPNELPFPPRAWGVPYAYGGNMATTRGVIESVGGFDDGIYAGGTEFEFCFRAAQEHGVRIVAVEDALVRHRVPSNSRDLFLWQFRRERGRCYLRRKFGADVVSGRNSAAWTREWRDVAQLLVGHARDEAARRRAATRAGSLIGRLWWSLRYQVFFL